MDDVIATARAFLANPQDDDAVEAFDAALEHWINNTTDAELTRVLLLFAQTLVASAKPQ